MVLNGLETPGVAGDALCLDGSNQVTKCGGATFSLQAAYDGGNTITTTGGRDIDFTLANDDNFTVTTPAGSTGQSIFSLDDGGATAPTELLLV